jgi:hypothetical protein
MDAELMTIFSNINSLVDQAKQMLGAGVATPDEPPMGEEASPEIAEKIMKFLKEMDEPKNETECEEEVEKADQASLSSPDEGVTATDGAKAIIDEKEEEQEKNLNEIARSIVKMLSGKKVQKSQQKTDELKAIKEEQQEIKKALENIFEGLGIADKVKNEVKKAEARKVENDPNEIKKSIDYIKEQLGVKVNDNRPVGNNNESVHKSLTDALTAMVSQ